MRLAHVRYRGGVDTQRNALGTDRDLFQAELALAQIRLEESLTVVELTKYSEEDGGKKGGWQQARGGTTSQRYCMINTAVPSSESPREQLARAFRPSRSSWSLPESPAPLASEAT